MHDGKKSMLLINSILSIVTQLKITPNSSTKTKHFELKKETKRKYFHEPKIHKRHLKGIAKENTFMCMLWKFISCLMLMAALTKG